MVHSKNKGAAGERELAREVTRLFGCPARRGQQFRGGPDSPDIITDIPGIHFESKRTERFQLYAALEQAVRDAGTENIPVVCHRCNRHPWVVVLKLDDLPRLVQALASTFTAFNGGEHEEHSSVSDTGR